MPNGKNGTVPDAWFQNELFEQTRDYLTRGRRFEMMRGEQVNEEWAKSFRQYVRLIFNSWGVETGCKYLIFQESRVGFRKNVVPRRSK